MPRSGSLRLLASVSTFVLVLAGCQDQVDGVREAMRDQTPREAYLSGLGEAGLSESALAQSWLAAGRSVVETPQPVGAPYVETGWWRPSEAEALGLLVSAERGQKIEVRLVAPDSTGVFLDLLRVPDDSSRTPVPVAASGPLDRELVFEPGFTADYLIRAQPELLRGGEYTLEVLVGGSLVFPVADRSMSAILSFFGDDRDGGARDHHGVDIFAPRGTPAIAAAAGEAYRVADTSIGGLVVWIRSAGSDRPRLYYAHLDSQVVRNGDRVEIGDTVGFIGNTGNARTTPPHLHFGVYRRGAEDPWPYLRPSDPLPTVDASDLRGDPRVTARAGADLRAEPRSAAVSIRELEGGIPLRVLAVGSGWLRVRGPDGVVGFLDDRDAALMTEGAPGL